MPQFSPSSPTESPLVEAANWIRDLLTGSLSMTIAVVAIALLGVTMLQGRLPWRDGARIVLGCFILFGSSAIAAAFLNLAHPDQSRTSKFTAKSPPPAIAVPSKAPQFDPYAGASVINH